MNKSESYFRELDRAWNRALEARARQGIVVAYITHWYRDEDGDVFIPYAKPHHNGIQWGATGTWVEEAE